MHTSANPGSDEAFADIVARYQWPLFGFARGMLHDDELARDIVQDIFCDAWRATQRQTLALRAPNGDEAARRWLFHAAYCRIVSQLRRRRIIRWESLDVPDYPELANPQDSMPFEDLIAEGEALRAAIRALPPEDAACVLLNVVQGFTSAAIAPIIGATPQAAKRRLSRAKQRLRTAYFAQGTIPQEISPHEHR